MKKLLSDYVANVNTITEWKLDGLALLWLRVLFSFPTQNDKHH